MKSFFTPFRLPIFFFLALGALLTFFEAVGAEENSSAVTLLLDPLTAGRARLDLIENAQQEIILSTYILADDTVGERAMAILLAALEDKTNPKRVVLILDDFGTP